MTGIEFLGIVFTIFAGGLACGIIIGFNLGEHRECMFWLDTFYPKKLKQDLIPSDKDSATLNPGKRWTTCYCKKRKRN